MKQAEWFKTDAGKAAVKTGGELLELGTTGHERGHDSRLKKGLNTFMSNKYIKRNWQDYSVI